MPLWISRSFRVFWFLSIWLGFSALSLSELRVSAATEDEPYKSYYKRFVQRLEKAGTERLSKKNGKPVYGHVFVNVAIDFRGRLIDIDVLRSEDHFLASHSTGLIRSLAPFEAFSTEMAQSIDRVVLGISFDFHP